MEVRDVDCEKRTYIRPNIAIPVFAMEGYIEILIGLYVHNNQPQDPVWYLE